MVHSVRGVTQLYNSYRCDKSNFCEIIILFVIDVDEIW